MDVVTWYGARYWSRPHPKVHYTRCVELMKEDQWKEAGKLCEPQWAE